MFAPMLMVQLTKLHHIHGSTIYCWNFSSCNNRRRNTNIIANFKIRDFFVCSTFTFSLRWLAAPIYWCIIKKTKNVIGEKETHIFQLRYKRTSITIMRDHYSKQLSPTKLPLFSLVTTFKFFFFSFLCAVFGRRAVGRTGAIHIFPGHIF